MKSNKHDAAIERRILTGMVVDDAFLGTLATRWTADGLFRVRWANLVGRWCVDYYRRYNQAPRARIEGLFTAWAQTAPDNNAVDMVDDFLGELSGAYEEEAADLNVAYLSDQAAEHFTTIQLETTADLIQGYLDAGKLQKAEQAAANWGRVELGNHGAIDVLHDQDAIYRAFDDVAEPLIRYPGALGKFFGPQLGRDEFISFTGQTGIGKSWWLMDLAWRALMQGRRVAFFEVGDMSEGQAMRRLMCRNAQRPIKTPLEFDYPTAITNTDGEVEVETKRKKFKRVLEPADAWRAAQRRLRRRKRELFKLSVWSTGSINVAGIRAELEIWERLDGWVPDVVVVDYADILGPPIGFQLGEREGINENWKQLRRMSQELHCLVATAAQGDTGSYTATTINRGNFTEDRRKNDHITGGVGISATEEELAVGVRRLNWTKRREYAYQSQSCVHVAGCLELAKPAVVSTF